MPNFPAAARRSQQFTHYNAKPLSAWPVVGEGHWGAKHGAQATEAPTQGAVGLNEQLGVVRSRLCLDRSPFKTHQPFCRLMRKPLQTRFEGGEKPHSDILLLSQADFVFSFSLVFPSSNTQTYIANPRNV